MGDSFNLNAFKREFSNSPETASEWLRAHMPEEGAYTLWHARTEDDIPSVAFVRANRINGYIQDISKTNDIFGILRYCGGDLEGLFLVKGEGTGPLEGSSIQDSFTIEREDVSVLVETLDTHATSLAEHNSEEHDFEDYILK
jgi:hypothetical protein